MDIRIEGPLIQDISKHGTRDEDVSARKIMLDGHFVIPGLIESHTHISPMPEVCLAVALEKGVVAIRDMAGDGAYILALQKAIAGGDLVGPDIYFSAVMGGAELIMNDSRVKLVTPPDYALGEAPWARLVEDDSDVGQVIADARECGASGIKLYAYLSADLTRRLAGEAKLQGLGVWAHLVPYPATAEAVVSSGVEVVSHAAFFLLPQDWEFEDGSSAMDPSHADPDRLRRLFATMKENRVALDPTLAVTDRMVGSVGKARADSLKRAVYEATRLAYEMGVTIVAGTDEYLPANMGDRLPLHRELELLVNEAGLTPLDALRAATINAAGILGVEDKMGVVERGMTANLVVLNRNPLSDIRATEDVTLVMKNGRIVE
jgi:imidazolonepropionase-like amidohydrolase